MKKFLFYIFAIIASTSLFAAEHYNEAIVSAVVDNDQDTLAYFLKTDNPFKSVVSKKKRPLLCLGNITVPTIEKLIAGGADPLDFFYDKKLEQDFNAPEFFLRRLTQHSNHRSMWYRKDKERASCLLRYLLDSEEGKVEFERLRTNTRECSSLKQVRKDNMLSLFNGALRMKKFAMSLVPAKAALSDASSLLEVSSITDDEADELPAGIKVDFKGPTTRVTLPGWEFLEDQEPSAKSASEDGSTGSWQDIKELDDDE